MNALLPESAPTDSATAAAVVVSTYNRPRALNLVLQGLFHQKVRARQIVHRNFKPPFPRCATVSPSREEVQRGQKGRCLAKIPRAR